MARETVDRPELNNATRPRAPLWAVWGTTLFGLFAVGGGLTLLLGPAIILVVGGMFAFAAAHYLAWGWRFSRKIEAERTEEETTP